MMAKLDYEIQFGSIPIAQRAKGHGIKNTKVSLNGFNSVCEEQGKP